MTLPVLVDCAPYRAKLRSEACVERWRQANGQKDLTSAGLQRSSCRGCAVGSERSSTEVRVVKKCQACGVEKKRLLHISGGFEICRICRAKGVDAKSLKSGGSLPVTSVHHPEVEKAARAAEGDENEVRKLIDLLDERHRTISRHKVELEAIASRQNAETRAAQKAIDDYHAKHPRARAKALAMLGAIAEASVAPLVTPFVAAPLALCPAKRAMVDERGELVDITCMKPMPCTEHAPAPSGMGTAA